MKTDELIDVLAADLKPVRRLLPPVWRLIGWLAVSVPVMALMVAAMRMRPDIGVKLAEPVFLTQELASLATAFMAGWAALVTCVPGEPGWKLWTPVAPLALWIATLGRQCWDEWMRLGLSGMAFHSDLMCLPGIAMIGAIPALAIVLAIRRGARLRTPCAMWWGSLAAAALANVALRLFHPEDAALMVIVWQFGSVLLFMTMLSLCRRFLVPERMVCTLR
ncbi:hypothetical protein AN403_5705 [Pseudomonas fluorescens]|uniref:DUF1109 domain-containing protein n=1 Tax=Pseudomonas fluorescens TaxID=294 RepID=A0A0N8NY02_PSEFL|nr:NrsF family protein [Pseudomonas fluorescens]KPU61633.1 hypothetical protein AN403_5705 [Pseudomonas fluorescens]